MITTMKEMGKVLENKRVCESIRDFHRKRFQDLYLLSAEKAKVHQEKYLWWMERIMEIDAHLGQLHASIRQSA